MNISNDIKLKESIKHFFLIKNKFYKLIVIFWLLGPFFFLLERSPADIWLSLIVLIFLLKSIIFKDWKWFQIKWFKFIFLFWIVSLTSALLSPMPIFTFGEGFFDKISTLCSVRSILDWKRKKHKNNNVVYFIFMYFDNERNFIGRIYY